MPLLRVWQTLFSLLLIATIVGAFRVAPNIQIDTDLADISPANQYRPQTQDAIAALRQNIEQRIILLVSGNDEETVYDAEEALRDALSATPNISVSPGSEEIGERILQGLKPYRFSLLNEAQQHKLAILSADDIAEQARTELYGVSGQVRAYPFQDDPLAWHSETLLNLLQGETKPQASDVFALPVNLSIQRGALNMNAQQALGEQLNAITDDIKVNHNVEIDRSGIFFFAAEAARSSKQDISFISTGSTIGVVLLLLLVFRSLRALILPVISIGLGVGFAFVLTHLIYDKVHVLTIVFGASLIGIVIDYSLHYFYHGASQHEKTSSNEKRALFRALALSLTTSVIGYAALSFSDLQALQKVAVFSCCGLFMAWLSVICLGDIALKKPLSTEQTVFPKLVVMVNRAIAKVPNTAWATVAIIVLIVGAVTAGVIKPYNDDPRVFFKAPSHLIESERRVAAVASDYEPGRYIIINGKSQSEVYQRHQTLMNKIKEIEGLTPALFTSLLNWVPSTTDQDSIYAVQSKLYSQNGAAEKLYTMLGNSQGSRNINSAYTAAAQTRLSVNHVAELLGSSLPPLWFEDNRFEEHGLKNEGVAKNNNVVSFVLIRKGVDTAHLDALLSGVEGVEYVNTLARTQLALAEQRISAKRLLLLAYALIALLMMIRFQSVRAIWLVVVPVCATAMLFLVSLIGGFTLNLFHIMALFLVLGFGMDYTIFAHEMRQHSNVTLQAILLSALTSLLSFGLLGLSAIPVVASFGVTLLVGNLFNLLGAFIYARTQTSQ